MVSGSKLSLYQGGQSRKDCGLMALSNKRKPLPTFPLIKRLSNYNRSSKNERS